jgi:hypothetical protein
MRSPLASLVHSSLWFAAFFVFPSTLVVLEDNFQIGCRRDSFFKTHFLFFEHSEQTRLKRCKALINNAEKPLATCGCRKFQLDPLGDHLNTCTAHSGAKKAHDWMVDQVVDLFRTTHTVKTQQVVKSRGQHCGDIQLEVCLANEAGTVPLVLDLRIAHDRITPSI